MGTAVKVTPLNEIDSRKFLRKAMFWEIENRDKKIYAPGFVLFAILCYMVTGRARELQSISTAEGLQIVVAQYHEREVLFANIGIPLTKEESATTGREQSLRMRSLVKAGSLTSWQDMPMQSLINKLLGTLHYKSIKSSGEELYFSTEYVLATILRFMVSGESKDLEVVTRADDTREIVAELRERIKEDCGGELLGTVVQKFI